MKKKKKRLHYTTKNDISWLGNRILKKDVAELLGISSSSVSRYASGKRKIPKDVAQKAKDLRFITPKKKTNHIILKKKRIIKVRETKSQRSYNVFKKTTKKAFLMDFVYNGRIEDAKEEILKISQEYGDNDYVVYSVIVFFKINGDDVVDGTTGYPASHVEKLVERFKKIMDKYHSHLKLASDSQKIIIRRTEYI